MRRGRNRRCFAYAIPATARFAALFAPGDYRFEASAYTVDGVSGKVGSFYNILNPAQVLAQATSANQVALPAASASLRNELAATFTGAERYDSTAAASAWNALHNGTGGTVCHVFRPTSALALGVISATLRSQDINTSYGSLVGYRTSGTNGILYRIGRGAAPATVDQDLASGAIANGTPTYAICQYSSGATPNYTVSVRTTVISSGAQAAAPAANDATATFKLGANGVTNDLGAVMEWAATWVWMRNLSAAERRTVAAYVMYRYAIAP